MQIYIESFIIQNILINFCLLKLIYLTTKSSTNFFKMLFSSIIGTIPSIFIILFLDNILIINLIKIFSAITIILITFKQSKKEFIFNFILLFLYTFAFGGLITNLSCRIYFTSFGAVTTSKFSLELICMLIILITYIFELVVKHLKFKIKSNNLIYNVTLTQNKHSLNIAAFMDTGNILNYQGNPVLILDLKTYLKLTKSNLINFLTKQTETIKTKTVSGQNNLKLTQIDKLEIKNKNKTIKLLNPYIAINQTNCFKNTNYQALLSPLFL